MPFYRRLAADEGGRRTLAEHPLPRESGRAFPVRRGEILRIVACEGPQVADLNLWCLDDPGEGFWSGRTRILEQAHPTVGHQLWSTSPRMRPMVTIIRDTVEHRPLPHGAASHDLIYARCSRRLYEVRAGVVDHPNCDDNLAAAIVPFGLPVSAVHDAFNVFMVTGIDERGRLFFLPSDARQGDLIELYAEIDCLAAISACPAGDCNGPGNHGLMAIVYETSGE